MRLEIVRKEIEVFPNKFRGAFKNFRIPSLVWTSSGLLVAFCEGRFHTGDHGDTDILVKVSKDGGKSWGEPSRHKIVVGLRQVEEIGKKANWRNPTSVYHDGKIYLFVAVDANGDSQDDIRSDPSKPATRFFFMVTKNSEQEWSRKIAWTKPREINVPKPYRWGAFGPGNAVVIDGKIVVPMNTNNEGMPVNPNYSFVVFSSDSGRSWKFSKRNKQSRNRATENQVVGLDDHRVVMSKRTSRDAREIWIADKVGDTFEREGWLEIETSRGIQTAIHREADGTVYITGPNCPGVDSSENRQKMSIWWAKEFSMHGRDWKGPLLLDTDRNSSEVDANNYSSIATKGDEVVVLYGDSKNGKRFARIVCSLLVKRD